MATFSHVPGAPLQSFWPDVHCVWQTPPTQDCPVPHYTPLTSALIRRRQLIPTHPDGAASTMRRVTTRIGTTSPTKRLPRRTCRLTASSNTLLPSCALCKIISADVHNSRRQLAHRGRTAPTMRRIATCIRARSSTQRLSGQTCHLTASADAFMARATLHIDDGD